MEGRTDRGTYMYIHHADTPCGHNYVSLTTSGLQQKVQQNSSHDAIKLNLKSKELDISRSKQFDTPPIYLIKNPNWSD